MPPTDFKSIANIIGLTSLDLDYCRLVDDSTIKVKNDKFIK